MKRRLYYMLFLSTVMVLSVSCKKYLTVEPEGYVQEENTFKTAADAITTVNGLYAQMLPLVDQIFLAGEAQGDLAVAARGADKYITEFAENRVTASNPYADYTKFYRLILACNRALDGLDQILRADPVNYNRAVYLSNRAEVYYVRAWTYLQLVKIWGDVPYVTGTVTKAEQVSNLAPEKSATIIKKILKDAEDNFSTILTINSDFLGTGNDFQLTIGQFRDLSGRCLLAELYLYDGNYNKAWEIISVIEPFGVYPSSGGDALNVFGMFQGQWVNWDSGQSRRDGNQYQRQVVMAINFDATKNQTNSLMKWTNNKYGGQYALKPSSIAIKNWTSAPMMLQQYQITPALGYYINESYNAGNGPLEVLDPDGNPIIGGYGDYIRGEKGSYFVDGRDTLMFKFLMKSRGVPKNPLINDKYADNDAFFNVYRDGPMYLLACEIMNNMGVPSQALLTMNGGSYNAYVYKSTRYRVGVAPFKIDFSSPEPAKKQVARFLIQESAMECAFEGRRWFDLVRIAKQANDPALLADAVAKKYPASRQAEVRARLMNPANWYLPVYKKN
ncbi:RagB/SusD family nutrient uptake outer membrane protein [Hufsiella ginkgonis]|uniref:RagB/SusD family nutrient uptake outer membrane protein n=1 Tax=Hufsiella ginkgonis TaxID=2695274 RepID=A0A7K1Y351_9SPHI|nr:RagB/SusD family nutrient uptake outer membrane protein [Hufsiella ginkgonis]MXV17662.1 RagB/SusD family nutrient uptake outer membrane protein [Hufsiella ginkgonis]